MGACGRGRPFARRPTGSGGGASAPEETPQARSSTRPRPPSRPARPPARGPSSTPRGSFSTRISAGRRSPSPRGKPFSARAATRRWSSTWRPARAGSGASTCGPSSSSCSPRGREDLDALAVTNTAAALLLALDTVANGRPVAVSRGELVAIGGDFRVPSILARSGASLLEVGTTNKTTPEDYAEAVRAGAAAILKVRPSNYRIVGFTEEVSLGELSTLCREARIPLLFDAGAGSPKRFAQPGLRDEPVPSEALAEGADLVCFSGDKTLGGPQAGILLGAAALVRACAKNPLARALRPDKLVLAALAATLDLHLSGRAAEIPFHAMLETPVSLLEERARRMAASAAALGWEVEAAPLVAIAGGGTGTESTLPSFGILLRHPSIGETEAAARLRSRELPVLVRISEGRLVVDLRSVTPEEDDEILEALEDAVTRP